MRQLRAPRRHYLAGMACLLLVAVAAACAPAGSTRTDRPLRPGELQNPRFDPPPPSQDLSRNLTTLASDLQDRSGTALVARLIPDQGAALWIALIVVLAVAVNFARARDPRNLELALLLLPGFLFFDILRFFRLFGHPAYRWLMDVVFIAIVGVSLALVGRALWRVSRPLAEPWRPNLPIPALAGLTLVLLSLNGLAGIVRQPDDAGFYTNLGAQRLRERGRFPYGDPLLTGTPGAAYGPVLYAAHLPFQRWLAPEPINPPLTRPPLTTEAPYYLPPDLATRLTTVAFHLVGVAGLFVAARRLIGPEGGWALTALYCGSAYVMGVGGDREWIGGMTFISHIAPAALTLCAFALLGSPVLAGALLASAMASLFYPAFFFPAWLGYYWPMRRSALRFVAGFVVASLVIGVPVLRFSRALEGHSVVSTILRETQGHQQALDAYGASPFGFWGGRDGVRGALMQPLVAGQAATSPVFLIFAVFVGVTFFLARGRGPVELALLTGALGIAAQLWKVHGTGVYVTWYYPFLLLGFLGAGSSLRSSVRPGHTASGLQDAPDTSSIGSARTWTS